MESLDDRVRMGASRPVKEHVGVVWAWCGCGMGGGGVVCAYYNSRPLHPCYNIR